MSAIFDVSILKTLRFNISYFGISGLLFPVLVSKNMILKRMRGGERLGHTRLVTFELVLMGLEFVTQSINAECGR